MQALQELVPGFSHPGFEQGFTSATSVMVLQQENVQIDHTGKKNCQQQTVFLGVWSKKTMAKARQLYKLSTKSVRAS